MSPIPARPWLRRVLMEATILIGTSTCWDAAGMRAAPALHLLGQPPELPPMNLVSSRSPDPNGFLVNPTWQHHRTSGRVPDPLKLCRKGLRHRTCTTNPTSLDTGRQVLFVCKPVKGTFSGHLNYAPVTYEGIVRWKSWEPPFLDGDYNFFLTRTDQAGYTSATPLGIGLEFASRETVDGFSTPWWKEFRDAVQSLGTTEAKEMVKDRLAVVTGLLGLDCVHKCRAELHPVYAMAIRVEESAVDERWAIFVRNNGGEGFCSRDEHPLPESMKEFVLRLPWRSVMTDQMRHVAPTVFRASKRVANPKISYAPGVGVFLRFNLAAPAENGTINGDLYLSWAAQPAPLRPRPTESAALPRARVPEAQARLEMLEQSTEGIAKVLLSMPADRRNAFIERMDERLPEPDIRDDVELALPPAERIRPGDELLRERAPLTESLKTSKDLQKESYDRLFERTWNEVFGAKSQKKK